MIDGSQYAPDTLFVVEPFAYPDYKHTPLVRGVNNISYPMGGEARVRHFTRLRPWAGIWLLSDGRNLTPVDHEANLFDPDGWFYSTGRDIFGAPNWNLPDVWPGPSISALNFRPGQKLVADVKDAPAEILVYEKSAGVEYNVAGSGNRVIAHGDRALVVAKDCAKSNTVRLNAHSDGAGFRAIRCIGKQNVFGSGRGLKYLGDMGFVYAAGYGSNSGGKVNVCMDFIGGLKGGIEDWQEYGARSAVYLDNLAHGCVVQNPVCYDLDIGVNVGGGWNNSVDAIRCVGVARPIVDEDRSHFKQIPAWGAKVREDRKNALREPASYDSPDWLYSSPKFGEVSSLSTTKE